MSHPAPSPCRLVRACRGETLDRPPVWLMRQAGRYLPEYRAIREKVDFLTLCKTPELAAEVSLQPLRRFGMDGVIMFSDILIPVEAMGMALEFTEKGPWMPQPLRTAADIHRLVVPDPTETTGFVLETLGLLKASLQDQPEVGLLGFAGAPWTLASYMLEGGVSRNFTHLRTLMYDEPALLHQLLDKIAQTIILYLNAQMEAGAQVVQLFDTWAGIVSKAHYDTFIHPYHVQIMEGLKHRQAVPVVLYINGSQGVLERMGATGADVVSLDWITPLDEARHRVGTALQGNLDPNALFAQPENLRQMTETMLRQGGNRGYIANLGHGILPQTPIENVRLFVETVKNSAPLFAGTPLTVG